MNWIVTRILALVMQLPGAAEALRGYLSRHEGAPLREALWSGQGGEHTALREALLGPNYAEVYAVLAADDYALLREWAARDGNAGLGALLRHAEPKWLEALFLASPDILRHDNYALFRGFARSEDGAPLRSVLFDDDFRMLRETLSRNSYEVLKAVVFDGPEDLFRRLATAHAGKPLGDLLFADGARILRDIIGRREPDDLIPLMEAEGERLLAAQPTHALLEVLGKRPIPTDSIDSMAEEAAWPRALMASERMQACFALLKTWEAFRPQLPPDDTAQRTRLGEALRSIQQPAHVRGRFLDVITEDDIVYLAHGSLHFPCRHSLWTLLHEILLHEDYFFPGEHRAPRIIDGGTHMGMAIYYFKALYPEARITGFEPLPMLHTMAVENVARNGFTDVEIHPVALSNREVEVPFYVSEQWTMAGSLYNRRGNLGEKLTPVPVQCEPLSRYLDGPVDFLKLDIEGAESEVLAEADEKLANVHYLFCEFHLGGGLGSERLARTLALLERVGFDVQVGKSHNFQETSRYRPFTHFDGAASLLIWARNRQWPPPAGGVTRPRDSG